MAIGNKNKIIRCGIIGCGNIAGDYDTLSSNKIRTHAKAFVKNENCNLVSVCDVNIIKAKTFANKWGVSSFHNNINDFLKDKLDIISICTPTETHKAIYEKTLLYNPKVIWLEKPSAYSCKDIKKMINLSKKGTEVWVNYFRKHLNAYIELKKKIQIIGDIQHINCYYTKGLQHNGSHLLDLIIFLFGSIIDWKVLNKVERNSFLDIDLFLTTKNTKIFIKALDFQNFELMEMDIIGTKGRFIVEERGSNIKYYLVNESKQYKGYKILKKNDINKNILNKFMDDNLSFGLLGKRKNELENDLIIQNIINEVIRDKGFVT